jgi:hypothetical protein
VVSAPEPMALTVSVAARMLRMSPPAFRAVLARQAKRAANPVDFRFDGLHCVKSKRGIWRICASAPWTLDGRPRVWMCPGAAAADLGRPLPGLLRAIQRSAALESSGATVARLNGIIACKFSGSWKVCIAEREDTRRV